MLRFSLRRCLSPWLLILWGLVGPGPASQAQTKPAQESLAVKNLPAWPGEESQWRGFPRFDFEVAGRPAYVVRPLHPAPGNPWVWRARFPDFHADSDQILLERGFHIARIQTDQMLGSPRAMEAWDTFYQFLTARGLHARCALEGVSRGGLFVYGFASRWPERVACIYADTPVMDIASWPGGRGQGLGSPETWQRLLAEYELTEEQARAYRGNPLDRLEPIARARIPLLHIVSANDQVVPPEENTLAARRRLRELGHDLQVITVAQGTEPSHGHHFDHPAVVQVADFMERHATALPPDAQPIAWRQSLVPVAQRFQSRKTGRVAFVGGSITNMDGWRQLTMEYLQQRFPETEFDFINAGIPSTGSVPGAFRLSRDALSRGPVDLVFEEASVNDLTNGRTPTQMLRGMEGIVRQVRQTDPATGIVVMHFACPDHTRLLTAGQVPEVIQQHEKVAQHYGVSTINLAAEVVARMKAEQFDWAGDFRDLHPSPYGHRLYAASIRRLLSAAWDEGGPSTLPANGQPLPLPLDAFSYDRGAYLSLDSATLKSGFTRIEDCDPRAAGIGGGVRPGFVNVPMLVASQPGATLELPFEGRAIGLLVAAGPDAGVLTYQIDDQPPQRLDLYTRWSRGLHLPWAYVLADELDPQREHRLRLTLAEDQPEGRAGHACRIVQFLINR